MHLIIDGYNVLKLRLKKEFISEQERMLFINELTQYAQKKKHTIILVFDGGSYLHPLIEKKGIVSVIYAGARKSADEVIKEYILKNQNLSYVIVSSDRELYAFAAQRQIPTVDADAFIVLLNNLKSSQKISKTQGSAHKLKQDSEDTELDELMREGTVQMIYKPEETAKKHGKHNKLSKKERLLVKISKKL